MRLQVVHVLLAVCSLFVFAQAWTKEDYEIFRLRDELEASEGPDVTFYDFVGVQSGASNKEIQDAFKKKSRSIHPDKVKHNFVASKSVPKSKKPGEKKKPGVHVTKGPTQREIEKVVKQATERYQTLGVIAKLLRSRERERYDHFLRHGFPKWRGTGYYYNRYRPGLGTVLVGLFLVGGGAAHYGALRISYNRQREFMEKYIRQARKSAWGDESGIRGIPGVSGPVAVAAPPPEADEEPDPTANLNRRQKRELERQNKKDKSKSSSTAVRGSGGRVLNSGDHIKPTEPTGERRRVTAENGKVLVVDSIGNVFLEEEDEDGKAQEFLLDIDEIHEPTFRDTAVVRLPLWLYRKMTDKFLKGKGDVDDATETTTTFQEEVVSVVEEVKEPLISAETKLQVPPAAPQQQKNSMTSSQLLAEEYEIVDSTGIEKDAAAGNNAARKRGKKGKK